MSRNQNLVWSYLSKNFLRIIKLAKTQITEYSEWLNSKTTEEAEYNINLVYVALSKLSLSNNHLPLGIIRSYYYFSLYFFFFNLSLTLSKIIYIV